MKPLLLTLLATCIAFGSADAQDAVKEHPDRKDVAGISTDDKEMAAAQEKARDTLMTFVKALEDRDEKKRYLLKVMLKEDDKVEHVWLEPVKWEDPGLIGILAVEPVNIKSHKRGDVVAPLPDDITDWLILSDDGAKEGGFTVDVIEKRKSKEG